MKTDFVEVYGNETNFFNRLSNLEKKRWLAEEIYLWKTLNIRSLSAYAFNKLT